jgi:hypothetical protein
MNAREAMRPTKLRKLGETVGEVAQRGAGRYGEHAECGYGNARTYIEAVQQEHKSSDRYGWNCE